MTDDIKELLTLAAKACGYDLEWNLNYGLPFIYRNEVPVFWTPHLDDGDAFRLANKLGLVVDCSRPSAAPPFMSHCQPRLPISSDDEATRMVILRAAAAIGKGMTT